MYNILTTTIKYINIPSYWKLLLVCILLFVISSIIIFVVCSYLVIKTLKLSIDDHGIFFYKYNKKSQKILDKYSKCKILEMNLIRQPFSKFMTLLLNILTFYNYDKIISSSQDLFPYHIMIMLKVKKNKKIKYLLIEKNNCINITDHFSMNDNQEIKQVKIKKNMYSVDELLFKTQSRIGNNKFFNWNMCKNNCQEFIKEILITSNNFDNYYDNYIFKNKILKELNPSEFTLHTINCICAIYNIIEKYIYELN